MLRSIIFCFAMLHGSLFADSSKSAMSAEEIKAVSDKAKAMTTDKAFLEYLDNENLNASKAKNAPQTVDNSVNVPSDFYKQSKDLLKGGGDSLKMEDLKPAHTEPYLAVLVTLAMPDVELKSILIEAARYNASVVIKGLYGENLKSTATRIASLVGKERKGGISINPVLFRQYEVTSVPTFIMTTESVERCMKDSCEPPSHVRASGSVSVEYFLEKVASTSRDPLAKSMASARLDKGKSK